MSTLVTQTAPDFTTAAVFRGQLNEAFNFYEATENVYSLIFFYPLDFTFVCPSELIALNKRIPDFTARKVKVITVSIDSHYAHLQWQKMPIPSGLGPVDFTMAADVKHHICRAYGVEHPSSGVALRASFVIDHKKQIRASMVYDLPIGRNIDEIIRVIDAAQFTDQHGEVCPANWRRGEHAMTATPEGVAAYLGLEEE